MKKNILKKIALLFAGLLLSTSCTKQFVERNTNTASYNQTNFDPNYLLTQSELAYTGSAGFAYETWRSNLIYCSVFMQGFSTVLGYWAGDKYLLNSAYASAYWDVAYPEQAKPIVDIVESTKDKPQYKNLNAVARILRALIFERITDLYGDVPYSEAELGYYSKIFYPKYDKQQDIYNDLITQVTAATASLDVAADVPTGDVIYKGNITKWKKFGNTLLLRLAMRLTKVDAAKAQTIVAQVAGKTLEEGDDAYVLGDGSGGRVTTNRNSQVLLGDGGQEPYYVKWSDTFINNLKSNNDPRLTVLACTQLYANDATKTPNANPVFTASVQKGQPNGLDFGTTGHTITKDPSFTTFPDYSSPSPYITKRSGPTFILTYAESELLLADAAQRFGVGGDAKTHYENGVKSAITYLKQYDAAATISAAAAQAYVTANPYNAATGLQQINTQYWILTNSMLDFYESWSNWRRSGFPVLTPVNFPNNVTSATIPRRFPYPPGESASNPDNFAAARAALTDGDFLTTRVWWDKK